MISSGENLNKQIKKYLLLIAVLDKIEKMRPNKHRILKTVCCFIFNLVSEQSDYYEWVCWILNGDLIFTASSWFKVCIIWTYVGPCGVLGNILLWSPGASSKAHSHVHLYYRIRTDMQIDNFIFKSHNNILFV